MRGGLGPAARRIDGIAIPLYDVFADAILGKPGPVGRAPKFQAVTFVIREQQLGRTVAVKPAAAIVGFVQSRITPTLKVPPCRSARSLLLQCCYNNITSKFLTCWQWGNHLSSIGLVQLVYSIQLHSAFHPRTMIAALRLEGAIIALVTEMPRQRSS